MVGTIMGIPIPYPCARLHQPCPAPGPRLTVRLVSVCSLAPPFTPFIPSPPLPAGSWQSTPCVRASGSAVRQFVVSLEPHGGEVIRRLPGFSLAHSLSGIPSSPP